MKILIKSNLLPNYKRLFSLICEFLICGLGEKLQHQKVLVCFVEHMHDELLQTWSKWWRFESWILFQYSKQMSLATNNHQWNGWLRCKIILEDLG